MKRAEIEKLLPHREPMLLLDEIYLQGETAVGAYTVRGDEYFLRGHFPGNPIVPGVILCEMMGQSACVLLNPDSGAFTPYFTGIDKVRFRNKITVGDTIELKTQLVKTKGPFHFVKSSASVRGQMCASGELSFAVIKENS